MESSEWKEAAAKGEMPVLDSDRLEGKLECEHQPLRCHSAVAASSLTW